MTINVTITNDEPEGSAAFVKLTVVTMCGKADVSDRTELLAPGQTARVLVGQWQFVMVGDKEA